MPKQVNNRPELKQARRDLRHTLTPAEATLWRCLQNKQLVGRKFRRQHSVGHYVLDFYCPSEKLAIELDGANHFTASGYESDVERTIYLNQQGIRVLRFENEAVFKGLEGILESITQAFQTDSGEKIQ